MADLSKIKLNGVEYDLKDAVARAAINNGLKLQVVEELPSENIDENTLYLVPTEPKVIREATTTISSDTIRIASIPFIQGNIYNVSVNAKAIYQETDIDTVSYQGSFTWNGETITLLEENNWVITAVNTRIQGVYSGANKDSLEMSILVKETRADSQYDCYLYINGQWESVKDSNRFMVKGIDYVTAGQKTGTTLGSHATAEGYQTTADGSWSHAEGSVTKANGASSHAEGQWTTAGGTGSHAEGYQTIASGNASHAESRGGIASGEYSHTEGLFTIAQRKSQHVFGEYNIADATGADGKVRGTYVEIVGNGPDKDTRSNARTLDWSGNEWLAGKLTVGAAPVNDMDVATKQYVDTAMSNVTVPTVEDMANVTAMLTNYGLNTTTTLSAAAAGTAELDSAVVQGV